MANVDVEKGGDMKNSENTNPPNRYAGLNSLNSSENQWRPFLVPVLVFANVVLFIVVMYVNDCPKSKSGLEGKCVPKFLGRFSLQKDKESFLGPSISTLTEMGAIAWYKIVDKHQGWRFFTSIWLHRGVIHLIINMASVLFIGIRLERQFGFVRIGMIYILSGFGASIHSFLYSDSALSVCASGPLFGLLGAMLSELLTNWSVYTNKGGHFFTMLAVVVINLLVARGGHNQFGGFLTGFFLGFVLLVRPQLGWMDRQHLPANAPIKSKYKAYQILLWVLALVLLIFGFAGSLVKLARVIHENGTEGTD